MDIELTTEEEYELHKDDECIIIEDIPEGCLACGGDYPNCCDSCTLFE